MIIALVHICFQNVCINNIERTAYKVLHIFLYILGMLAEQGPKVLI